MTMGTQQYAYLADHSYGRDEHGRPVDLQSMVGKVTEIGGLEYKVLAYADKPSGYQGAVYQRMDTGEIVVAHRGTEFDRQKLEDLVKTDGGMVVGRNNQQADDAIALTSQAIELAKDYGKTKGVAPPEVTVTGHSLGGTLAEITGHYFGLKGETFNAFGAASLNMQNPATGETYRIPEGGNGMVNHVMAADLVSSASPHYGRVEVYTNQREIDTLEKYGYENNRSMFDLRNDIFGAVAAMRGGSHDMHNFLPWNGDHQPDTSILADPSARGMAQQYDPMIDKFRSDISGERLAATLLTRSGKGLLEDAWQLTRDPLPAGEPARRAEQQDRRGASLAPGALPLPDMRDPAHPANGRYQQAYAGVSQIDQGMGRAPDGSSERLAAALTAASPHLSAIDRVGLSPDGSRAFAVEASNGPVEARQRAQVDVASAVQRPVEASTAQWQVATDQLAQSHARQQAQERANPVVQGPVMG
ncbi:XVIPCD domain-containing protein [Pseudoxanthomonas sp. JBR18]|uniref:XVIPCD domain-containing protein n=1 Tax=Pseudoxanthomonas sp. JBR18 TaxID=2969308 RepID=UPI002304D563|nr:XVIPCD domain-containing protein [Pseudoxanthomonas sp. JBR18]WCE03212.1 hypothetical protein PJ250_13970 [Pseudoxanthomonas sp. JBR18]